MFRLGNGKFSDRRICIVGEVAQAHDGNLETAHKFIDDIAGAGADAVKFQTHIAAAESTPEEPWRVKFSRQDKTRYDYWKRMEFSEKEWYGLRKHAEKKGLIFLSSPFSLEAAKLLKRAGVTAWKVASGEVNDLPMLEYILATGLPIILSTGMSSLKEIDRIVKKIVSEGPSLIILQATSSYPALPEKIGMNMIPLLKKRYGCPVGISDHSGTIFPALSAATLGASMVEVHVTSDRRNGGPDVSSSVTIPELKQIVEGVRFIEKMLAHPVDKDAMYLEMKPMRRLFAKSVVAKKDLAGGAILRSVDLTVKKPGTGIPAEDLPKIIGRRLKYPVKKDTLLKNEDLKR